MAELWTILRDYNEYMVLIGGWVPFFLLQRYGEGSVEHVGSLDIDLALNAQAIPVDAYETILDRLQDRGYHHRVDRQGRPIPFSFERAVVVEGGSRVVVQVDLLAPQYGGTGPRHRHQVVQDLLARKVRGADLVFDHFEVEEQTARLPNGAQINVQIKIADAVSCFVMKGIALASRASEKDAYDLYLLCKNYKSGPASLAAELQAMRWHSLIQEALKSVTEYFDGVDAIGPIAVADFLEVNDPEEREVVCRDAYEVLRYMLEKAREDLTWRQLY